MILLVTTLLLIIPALLGSLIKKLLHFDQSGYSLFYFSLGFLVMVAEFALICYPAIFLKTPFHTVCSIVLSIYVSECLISVICMMITKKALRESIMIQAKQIGSLLCSPALWSMLVLCGFQIIRLIIFAPAEMRDSKSYSPLVIDVLQSDSLFTIRPEDGFSLVSILEMPLKFCLSPWYPFQAMLAKTSNLHPLIISNTVLPAYILLISYIILFSLGFFLFEKNHAKAAMFTAACAIIQELTLFSHTPTLIKLVWPVWGKGVLSMTIIPAILVIYMLFIGKRTYKKGVWLIALLLLLTMAGCSMSTMAAVAIPLELGLLGLIWTLRNHSIRPLLYSVISCCPSVLYLIGYYYLSSIII